MSAAGQWVSEMRQTMDGQAAAEKSGVPVTLVADAQLGGLDRPGRQARDRLEL